MALLASADVRRYLGGPAPAEHVEAIRQATVGERWGAFCVADLDTDVAVGAVSFGHQRDELEVSYEFLPEHWGSGLATEAVAAALEWAWVNHDDGTIIAVTQTANEPSLCLLRRLGFGRRPRVRGARRTAVAAPVVAARPCLIRA